MSTTPDIQRHTFLTAMAAAVLAARTGKSHIGLLLIDLRNLAHINHSFGYATGDEAISSVYELLLGISKMPDTVFRIGGHHFAFILPGLTNPAHLALAMNRVQGLLLGGKVRTGDNSLRPDIKMGASLGMHAEKDATTMLAAAESSLRGVKRGKEFQLEAAIAPPGKETSTQALERLFLDALMENGFELYYQPKVDLVSGSVFGAEALLRWTTPSGERVSPEQVVKMAEQFGKSFELTKGLASLCMRDLARWRNSLNIGLALNVQASLVNDNELESLLRDAAAIWGIEPGWLTVEITEDAFITDMQEGANNLQKLKDAGFRLSIDDFGTGYSSMSYFKHIPAVELKIDRSFVRCITSSSQDQELVKIMVQIAQQFGLKTVAEGIEDEESARILRDMGCDYGQGYYFSPPLRHDEFEEWVKGWECSNGKNRQQLWPRVCAAPVNGSA